MSGVEKLDEDDEAMAIRGLATVAMLAALQSSDDGISSEMMDQGPCGWAGTTFGDM